MKKLIPVLIALLMCCPVLAEENTGTFIHADPFFENDNNRLLYLDCVKKCDYQKLELLCDEYIENNSLSPDDPIISMNEVLHGIDFSMIDVVEDAFDGVYTLYHVGCNEISDSVHIYLHRDSKSTTIFLTVGFIKEDGWFFADEVVIKKFGDNDADGVWFWDQDFDRETLGGQSVKESLTHSIFISDAQYLSGLSTEDQVGIRFKNSEHNNFDIILSNEEISALSETANFFIAIDQIDSIRASMNS